MSPAAIYSSDLKPAAIIAFSNLVKWFIWFNVFYCCFVSRLAWSKINTSNSEIIFSTNPATTGPGMRKIQKHTVQNASFLTFLYIFFKSKQCHTWTFVYALWWLTSSVGTVMRCGTNNSCVWPKSVWEQHRKRWLLGITMEVRHRRCQLLVSAHHLWLSLRIQERNCPAFFLFFPFLLYNFFYFFFNRGATSTSFSPHAFCCTSLLIGITAELLKRQHWRDSLCLCVV